MARETRIGLVVGMGFIICFAVILSHRGQPPAGSTPQPFGVIGTGQNVQPLVNTQLAEQRARRLGRDREPVVQTRQDAGRSSADRRVAVSRLNDRTEAASDAFVFPRRSPLTDDGADTGRAIAVSASRPDRFTARGEPLEVGEPPVRTTPQVQTAPVAMAATESNRDAGAAQDDSQPLVLRMPPRLDNEPQTPEEVLEAVANMPVTLSDAGATSSRRRPAYRDDLPVPSAHQERPVAASTGAEPQATNGNTQGETYTIQPGDTLTRIAKVRYGTSDPSVLDAIFEANRDSMKSPDHIVVGRTIVLPNLEGDDGGATPVPTESPKSAPAPTPPKKDKPVYAVVYEIQPGDSLSKIASRHYGSAAPRIIDAICEANAKVIASRDKVIVGRKINLPEIEGVGAPSAPSALEVEPTPEADHALVAVADVRLDEPDADTSAPMADGEGIGWRWYQLQKGDVYSRVAARHLGSSKRWKELAEMNKDIFPDPGRIRHGVLIRVPIDDGSAVSSEDYGQRG